MPATRISPGVAGSVFILGVVGLVPLLVWSALLLVAAMIFDVRTMITHSVIHVHLSHRSQVGR